ncbi:MAG: hypothetical protein D4R65_00220, partial [Verrucomicrobiaceae bacterium]
MKQKAGGKKRSKDSAKPSPEEGCGAVDLDNIGDLPRSYGSDTIFLVAQEPHWLFTYWDIDIALHPGGKTFLRIFGSDE